MSPTECGHREGWRAAVTGGQCGEKDGAAARRRRDVDVDAGRRWLVVEVVVVVGDDSDFSGNGKR